MRNIHTILHNAMTYTDALAVAVKNAQLVVAGHEFTTEIRRAIAGHYELTATDSHDGQRYTITIEPEPRAKARDVHVNWGASRNWEYARLRVLELYPQAYWGGNYADIKADALDVAQALREAGFEVSRGRETDPYDLRIKEGDS